MANEISVNIDTGYVSIGHWGAFDISPFGAILRSDSLVWFRNGEPIATIPAMGTEMMQFMTAVGRL